MEKTVIIFGVLGVLICISYFPAAETRKPDDDRIGGVVPAKEILAQSLNNLTLSPGDFSRKDRKVTRRRPGSGTNTTVYRDERRTYYNDDHHPRYGGHGRHGRYGRHRYHDRDGDSDSDSRSDERYSHDTDESRSREGDSHEDDGRYYVRRRSYGPWGGPAGRQSDACSQPRRRGKCVDLQKRWYYNNQVGECRSFTYGGCGGNANNFVSQKNCENFCAGGSKGQGQGDPQGDAQGEEVEEVEEITETETETQ